MCDCDLRRGLGWKGWRPLPPFVAASGHGAWHDLSHPLDGDAPRVSFFPRPTFEAVYRIPDKPLNVTRMDMIVHIGTHIDSPRHFFVDGPALEDIPVERLCGRGIVWPVRLAEGHLVEPLHLAGLESILEAGDILVINTGWHQFVGSPKYDDEHPALSLATADWIVSRGVKLVGLDFPTPDLPVAKRPDGFDYPIHRRLLSQGVMIAEHLTNLSGLDGQTVEILCMGLNIIGGDGAPARIVARSLKAGS